MKALHNKIEGKLLREAIHSEARKRTTLSFYKYWNLRNPHFFRDYLYLHLQQLEVFGRIYVAKEGINAQISVPDDRFSELKDFLESINFLEGNRLNVAVEANAMSFFKLIIKVRDKIVADGLNDDTFDVTNKGKHLNAREFNELTDDPDTIIVDMRNHYESEVGHFERAILPDADTFREELPLVVDLLKGKEEKNIVMYCTGGIRCEKASAWMKHNGFTRVHQLEGGIIEYARQVKAQGLPNKFRGKNFVFDERLGERISEEVIANCHVCGNPADTHYNCRNTACHVLFIECDACREKLEGCCSEECRNVIYLPQEEQQELRKQLYKGVRYFHKGRGKQLVFRKRGETKK
jgi:UPF0176 protein